jgi:pimeloyl-ACP methyl ester carboxylesterase
MRSKWIVTFLLLYSLVVMGLSRIVDHLILHPSRERVFAGEAIRRILPDSKIEVWIHQGQGPIKSGKPKLFLLHFIGNASRAEWEHPIFLDLLAATYNVEAWAVNYPGYGKSEGDAKLKAIPEAAMNAYRGIREAAQSHPLLLSGNSLGTSAALYLATKVPAKGVILQNPPPLQNMIVQRFGWWNLWLIAGPMAAMVPSELNSLSNAPKSKIPAVFITSEFDITVPPAYQRKIMDKYGGPSRRILIPGASHNTSLPSSLRSEAEAAIQWMIHSANSK